MSSQGNAALTYIVKLQTLIQEPLGQNPQLVTDLFPVISSIKIHAQLGITQFFKKAEFIYPDFVPPVERNEDVKAQLIQLATLAVKIRPAPMNQQFTTWGENECLQGCQLLIKDGYTGANTLAQSIRQCFEQKQWKMLHGWKYQLYMTLVSWSNYELLGIEVEYGTPNPSTGYKGRVDVVLLGSRCREFKMYKNPNTGPLLTPTEEQAFQDAFWNEFNKYAGVASSDGGKTLFGGINYCLNYVFKDSPLPSWISDNFLPNAQKARLRCPWAFPDGLQLNGDMKLPPFQFDVYKTPVLSGYLQSIDQIQGLTGEECQSLKRNLQIALNQQLQIASKSIRSAVLEGKSLEDVITQAERNLQTTQEYFIWRFHYVSQKLQEMYDEYMKDASYTKAAGATGNQQGLEQWRENVLTILNRSRESALNELALDGGGNALAQCQAWLKNLEQQVAPLSSGASSNESMNTDK